jgi:hypothetical protein
MMADSKVAKMVVLWAVNMFVGREGSEKKGESFSKY